MALSMEDMERIKNELDDRYVMQADCNDKQETVNKNFADMDKEMAINSHDVGAIKKLLWILTTTSIGSLVTALFELILR